MVQHGGGIDAARERFGEGNEPWLDLSTGINPEAYPIPAIDPMFWQRLPDHAAEHELIHAARSFYCVNETAEVVSAPGSQSLIQSLPTLFPPARRVGVMGFTYAEHAVCWRREGHDVVSVAGLEGEVDALDVLVVVQPNNPDGRVLAADDLQRVARRLASKGGLLVVDEAFAEVVPGASLARSAGMPGLCVLRSFGKFFGLAGTRLGFALCHEEVARRLRARLGPWAVSGPTIAVAKAALSDRQWSARMRTDLQRKASALNHMLLEHGLQIRGGTDLFVLVEHPRAGEIFEGLARRQILTRPFEQHPRWLRIGLPAGEAEFQRLSAALTGVLTQL